MVKEKIGGQALVDGVLFRNQDRVSIARRRDGRIVLEIYPTLPLAGWHLFLASIPVLRGILAFLLILYSFAQLFKGLERRNWEFWLKKMKQLVFILVILLGLPLLLSFLLWPLTYYAEGIFLAGQPLFWQMGEKLFTYLLLMLLFSVLANLFYPTLFAYHGAEHQALVTYEKGRPLEVEEARSGSRLHPRCGTSFFVLIALLDSLVMTPWLTYCRLAYGVFWQLFLIGLAYELALYVNKNCSALLCRGLQFLGLLLQRVTTKEPTDDQLEVALAALRGLLKN